VGSSSSDGLVAEFGVGGCCVIFGTFIPVDPGKLNLGILSATGLSDALSDDQSRRRVSKARKAASHLISSSSDGAQSTKVRLAVTMRKTCSSGDPASLSTDFFVAEVASFPRILNCRDGPLAKELSDGASRSESVPSVPDPSGSNSSASRTAERGT
jgi:hypothetical protein